MAKYNTPEIHRAITVIRRDLLRAEEEMEAAFIDARDDLNPSNALCRAKVRLDEVNRKYTLLVSRLWEG